MQLFLANTFQHKFHRYTKARENESSLTDCIAGIAVNNRVRQDVADVMVERGVQSDHCVTVAKLWS